MRILSVLTLFVLLIIKPVERTNCERISRVIGGTEVECGSQIRVASLIDGKNSRHLCGATLINREVAVTAAHCVQEPFKYVLQLNNVCVHPLPKAKVLQIIRHPLYDKYTSAHDIALLRLALGTYNITWPTDAVLPNNSFGLSGECNVYGYGYTNSKNNSFPNRLKFAKLKIISLDECTSSLGEFVAPRFDSGMICAIGDGADTCQIRILEVDRVPDGRRLLGSALRSSPKDIRCSISLLCNFADIIVHQTGDSGGPVMCEEKLQGITSYGLSCAVRKIPGVYTSIGMHLPWIHETIKCWKINYSNN